MVLMKGNDAHELVSQQIITDVLIDSIGDGAITTDEHGNVTRINPVAVKLLGYPAEEVIGRWFPELFTSFDENGIQIPLIDRPITRAFVSGQILSEHVIYRHKNGSLVRLAITISPIMVKDVTAGCIQIFRDIGAEYEIDKMKSDFISLASHQLRTPLSAIKTYAHMLLDGYMGKMTKAQTKSLKTIVAAANRMNDTVSTLLNISRIENGSVISERKVLALPKLFDAVIEEHQLSSSEKSINLIVNYPPAHVKLISDEVILKEIIGNLVSNAIKYTPEGGTVKLSSEVKANQLIIIVEDTGVGIPSESRSNVFSKFFRAENVIRQETSGTGLGLYLVKGLINELDGEVWFESEEDKGTTFYLSLPLTVELSSALKTKAKPKVKNVTAKWVRLMA